MSSDQRDLMLRGGAKVWNRWRQANSPDMTFSRPHWYDCPNRNGLQVKGRNRLNFSKLNLSGARVYDAFAEGLNLSGAILENVYFDGGDFSRASFAGATIRDSKFNKTIFTDASFNEATIVNCNLNRVNLVRADFTVSEISETVVYGISAWDLTLGEQSKQSKLIIEPTHELYSELVARGTLPSMVDDIELAQFIYFLSGHKRLRDAINILNDKAILLLGRFADGGIAVSMKSRID